MLLIALRQVEGSGTFAELLIDCKEDRTLRVVLVGMLREERRMSLERGQRLVLNCSDSWLRWGVSADEIRQASYLKLCASEDNPTSMSEPYARTRWRWSVSWVLVDAIKFLPQLVTKPRGRPCVVCRTRVKRGLVECPKCGHKNWPARIGPLPPLP